ncbi:RagB/SusD family nutrient uptake outer membrane protein [Pedobacter faecalis]|uniref:RagB/SusD family nutrient uptake outer membrane protein n=1 Tax=Pedobacter faecalis TaxID=3041495 RepID=UPI0025505445|nr:RagB/SusD family nutrient uptake outer membrane protein [Pedobacter sp. ELA7]
MKKYIIYLFVLLISVSTGCKKYLEQAPDQRSTLNSPSKISELLVTAYPRGNYALVAEAMSDNPIFNSASGLDRAINRNGYFWERIEDDQQDSPDYYWNSCYTAIAAANQALDAIEKSDNPSSYTAQRGEALVARAYAHFMLVTFYSKPYDKVSSETDPGVPYVTEPENVVFKNYERKTVAYVYAQIEKDLLEGMPLINDNYSVLAYHFTRKAAYAFATRYYLFKKEADKVIEYANLAFPANNFAANFRPWNSYAGFSGSTEIAQAFNSAANPGNLLLGETTSWAQRYYARGIFSLSQNRLRSIIAPIGTTLSSFRIYSFSSTFYFVPKFYEHFVRNSINATTGRGYVMMPLLTTEEVLLSRAEAYIMQDKYADALTDINTLFSARITNYSPSTHNLTDAKIKAFYDGVTNDTKQAYINAVLDVRRAEFLHEGIRWMDILRHKLVVKRDDANGFTATLTEEDNRKQWLLPAEVVLSGIEQNPR